MYATKIFLAFAVVVGGNSYVFAENDQSGLDPYYDRQGIPISKSSRNSATNISTMAWITGNYTSCLTICSGQGYRPVSSGNYTYNGINKPFYVCSANAGQQGMRPGYNLDPFWNKSCWVGIGGKESPINPYSCLCYK